MKKTLFISLILFFNSKILADEKMTLGLEVYNKKAMCGTCHTLQAADSKGQIGPNLDLLKPQMPQIIYTVTNGVGVMPAFDDTLTLEEIEAVAYYIFNSTNN
tara:strand:+ start:1039 stop:1344 length:306 start_codon:yes stop_codon:yes gene_type:complete